MSGVQAPTIVVRGLGLDRLTALTRRVAAEVLAGRHEVPIDPERRFYRRLRVGDTADVWLIGWATGQATELHDHGGSLGALTVVSGVLSERRWAPHRGGIRVRLLRAGRSQGFRLGHVHDVINPLVDVGGQRARLLPAAHGHVLLRGRRRGARTTSRTDDAGRLAGMTASGGDRPGP